MITGMTVKERVKVALKAGPKTPAEISINLYGAVEKLYRSPRFKDRPPKLICKDFGGAAQVQKSLWEMKKTGEVRQIKKGLYALPE